MNPAHQVHQDLQELQVLMDHQDHQDLKDPVDQTGLQVQMVNQDLVVHLDLQVHLARKVFVRNTAPLTEASSSKTVLVVKETNKQADALIFVHSFYPKITAFMLLLPFCFKRELTVNNAL